MSEFVAGAFVDVKPDTKGFRDELKRKVNASIKSAGTFKVPIQFEIKSFKRQLQDAARTATPKIPVTVGGNVEQLRKDINDKIRRATTGMTIKVPVEVVPTGAGSRGGTVAPPAGTPAPTRGTADAGTARKTRDTQKLTEAQKLQAVAEKALVDLDTRAAVTAKLLASATEQGIKAEQQAQLLREARVSATAQVRVSTEALAKTEAVLTAQQKTALETARAEALATREDVIAQQARAKAATTATVASDKALAAREAASAVMVTEVAEITNLNDLHVLENELLAAEAALKRATNKARDAGLTSLAAENDLLLTNIGRRKEEIALQRANLKGEGKLATQRKTSLRGIGATILSNFGLRGATLAASGAFLVGAAAATTFTKSLKTFAAFEAELNTFKAVAGATNDQMKQVSATAKQLGADITLPAVSSADAAEAMTELARAGLDVQNSIEGARGVLQLATAAQIDNAEAATLVATGLNAFNLSGSEATHVADLLANAANAAQGSISEMGAALQQAAAISHQVGISLDDTVAILTLFARNGLRGSDAGTSLRTALARLIAPTDKASKVIADLGLKVRDANGNIRPEVFADFRKETEDLTPALRDMLAETIAGQDSIRAFAIGGEEGARGLQEARLEMAQVGTAAAIAKARTDGLAGAMGALSSTAETLGETLGSGLATPIENLADAATTLLGVLNDFAQGDFKGGVELFGQDQLDRAKQQIEGVGHLFTSIVHKGDLSKGLKEIFGPPEHKKSAVETTLEELDRLQKLRIGAFKAHLDIGPITDDIKTLRAKLREEKVDAGLIIPVTPIEKALAPLKELRRNARETRIALRESLKSAGTGEKPAIQSQIEDLNTLIAASTAKIIATKRKLERELAKAPPATTGFGLAKQFEANIGAISKNIDLATPEVLGSFDDLIAKIGKVPVGSAPKSLGLKIVKEFQIAIDAAVANDDPALAAALKAKAEKIAALFGISLAEAFKKIKIPLTSDDIAKIILPDQIAGARAEAFGTVADQITAKQKELADLQSHLPGGGALKTVKKGSQEEFDLLQEIIGVQGEIAGLQKDATDTSKADTAVLDAISGKEQALQNKIAIAQTTDTLNDDIKAERALRAFYVKQIDVVRQTVKSKEERNKAIADLKQKLFELDLNIAGTITDRANKIFDDAAQRAEETETLADDLRVANRRVRFWENQVKTLKELVRKRKATAAQLKAAQEALSKAEDEAKKTLRARRQQRRENRQERLDLQIQIAQDNGNVKAEIRAREAQIKNTQALIRQTRKGSLQRLRLIAQLRQEQKELRDLKKEKDKSKERVAALQRAEFEFLQTIQGFAFNLIGNLIPGGLTGGLVGGAPPGGAPPGGSAAALGAPEPGGILPQEHGRGRVPGISPNQALQSVRTTLDAQKDRGVSAGQGNTQIVLLRKIFNELHRQNKGMEHPEAKSQRKTGSAAMDFSYRGTHGM